jgi:hypothetical protein
MDSIQALLGLGFSIVFIIAFVIITRLLGAWMLRINEVIDNQKAILTELKKQNNQPTNKTTPQ